MRARQDIIPGKDNVLWQKHIYLWLAEDSVVGITKEAGQSHHNYRYLDFGEIENQSTDKQSSSNFLDPHNHYTYTGQEFDENLEMYEFYSRSYDPVNATWNRQDEYRGRLNDPQSVLRYLYVNQSPVNFIDFYGFTISDSCQSYVMPDVGISDKCQSFGFFACAILEIFIALIIGAIIGVFIGKYLSKKYL